MKNFLNKYFPGLIIVFVLTIVAFSTNQQYGISWDEPVQRDLAHVTYRYISGGDKVLNNYDDRALGTAFELPLYVIEKVAKMTDTRAVYLMRHLITHLYFLLSVFCGYVLALRLFKKQWIAILGMLMLVLEPRLYAHSFFNSKDLPFLSAMLVSLLFIQVAFDKNMWRWYLLAGFTVGYAMGIRIIGIILVPAVASFIVVDIINAFVTKQSTKSTFGSLAAFLFGSVAMLYLSWPYLWAHPIQSMQQVFTRLSAFPWRGYVLFDGKIVHGEHLPLRYLPTWMAITIPELWSLLFAIGAVWVCVRFARRPLAMMIDKTERNFLLYFFAFLFPAVAVIANHTVIIDDWRHVYFIYPPLVFLGLYGLSKMDGLILKVSVVLLTAQTALVFVMMLQLFPFSQVYFNFLKPHKEEYFRNNFDLEYWSVTYYQGMKYITDHDHSDSVRIYHKVWTPEGNAQMFLPKSARDRVVLTTNMEEASYLLTSFRWQPKDLKYPVYYEIKRENSTIMRVYKLK